MTLIEVCLTDWQAVLFMAKYFAIGSIFTIIAAHILKEFRASKEEDSRKIKWEAREKRK